MSEVAIHVDQTRAPGALIGASDAAAALGLDSHRSPISVWRRLRGLDSEDPQDSEPARWGRVLEPIVRGEYAIRTRSSVAVPESSVTRDGWLRATPDGYVTSTGVDEPIVVVAEQPVAIGLLQCKTASAYLDHEWTAGPPARYEVQVRVELAVCDLPWADVACLIGGQRYVCYRVERDAALELRILRDLRDLWERAASGVEPDVDASEDWRRHLSQRMAPSAVVLQSDEDLDRSLVQWRAIRSVQRAGELAEDEIKNVVLKRLADAGATRVRHPDGDVIAQRKAGQVRWREYALALGGTAEGSEKFRGEPGEWFVTAPRKWSNEP